MERTSIAIDFQLQCHRLNIRSLHLNGNRTEPHCNLLCKISKKEDNICVTNGHRSDATWRNN